MKKSIFIYLLAGLLILASCASQDQKDNTINLSGAFALYPMVVRWTEEYQKENPDIRFNISAGGAGKGMTDALSGTVDLGMFSREISQAEKDKGVWWIGLCKDAVIPTISANNPYLNFLQKRGLTKEEFIKIFIEGSITDWKQLIDSANSETIQIFSRSDACGAAGTWAEYLGATQEDLKGIGINGDPALADAVAKEPRGIGFNNTAYIYDAISGNKRQGMEVIPIDVNGNGTIEPEENFYDSFKTVLDAIANGNYPSPPARELYFVAKGKPQKQATVAFIEWTLTKGQQFIIEAGYVPIKQDKIDAYLQQLKN